ncbi:hypothetical protein ACN4EG_00090 [Alkalinema pantanalense CENA528]|uniref:hypothetical protein n=1 Tax=Alkalinema pantanalense TaxID=1620705 RepID=UPI003D6EB971
MLIEQFQGNFEWLIEAHAPYHDTNLAIFQGETDITQGALPLPAQVTVIEEKASELGLRLPPAWVQFLKSAELFCRIRSVTCCYFELGESFIPFPVEQTGENGYLMLFLSDSQSCVLWYLYINPVGEHCVISSNRRLYPGIFEDQQTEKEELGDNWDEDLDAIHLHFCASSFEEFIYRFWIENEIWFKVQPPRQCEIHREAPLSEAQQAYADHYRNPVQYYEKLRRQIRQMITQAPISPWQLVAQQDFTVLDSVGYGRGSDYILLISDTSRQVYDCLTGNQLAEVMHDESDDSWFDSVTLSVAGIGPLQDQLIALSGTDSDIQRGEFRQYTEDGFGLWKIAPTWPDYRILLSPPGAVLLENLDQFIQVAQYYESMICGFSPTSQSFIVATTQQLLIFSRTSHELQTA